MKGETIQVISGFREGGLMLTHKYAPVKGTRRCYVQRIFVSNDQGRNWQLGSLPGVNDTLENDRCVYALDGTNFFVTSDSVLWASDDGGRSWKKKGGLPGYPYKMEFFSPEIGYLLASTRLYSTIDGGNTWKCVSAKIEAGDFWFATLKEGYISVSKGREGGDIYQTVDAGKRWKLAYHADHYTHFMQFQPLRNPKRDAIWLDWVYSKDHGKSWHTYRDDFYYPGLGVDSWNRAYIDHNGLERTSDFGKTWEKVDSNFTGGLVVPGGPDFSLEHDLLDEIHIITK